MNSLYIYDVSPFIHAGHVNKYSSLTRIDGDAARCYTLTTPTGGTSLIMNSLFTTWGKGDVVFCCDRNPTIKKDMIPGYKGSRDHKHEIAVEKEAAEYILKECGGTVLAYDGYEADDIIYSLVLKYHDLYDNIYILTSDSDLYFLVDDKVEILPSSSRAKQVNKANYEKQTKGIQYNCCTAVKIAWGDASDEIPGLPQHLAEHFLDVINAADIFEYCGNKDVLKMLFSDDDPEILRQIDNVFPLIVDDLPNSFSKVRKEMLINFGVAINNTYFRQYRPEPDFDIEKHIDVLHSRGCFIEGER